MFGPQIGPLPFEGHGIIENGGVTTVLSRGDSPVAEVCKGAAQMEGNIPGNVYNKPKAAEPAAPQVEPWEPDYWQWVPVY